MFAVINTWKEPWWRSLLDFSIETEINSLNWKSLKGFEIYLLKKRVNSKNVWLCCKVKHSFVNI